MVEETQKFKEKLKQYEDQVSEYQLLEQKKSEVEQKLATLEKKYRETFSKLDEERLSNRKLSLVVNQLRRFAPSDFNMGEEDGEDILYIQDEVQAVTKPAGIVSIKVTNKEDRDSPEPSNVPPTQPHVQSVKIATVQKSACVKQNNAPYSPKVVKSPAHPPPPPPSSVHGANSFSNNSLNHSSTPGTLTVAGNAATAPKRHSYEDRKHTFDFAAACSDEQPPHLTQQQQQQQQQTQNLHFRNSLESINTQQQQHQTTDTFNTTHLVRGSATTTATATTTTMPTMRHNSCEEVRNVGTTGEGPKRNSYEGDSSTKKTPPPAPPPRRGSTLSSAEKTPPVVKVPHQFQHPRGRAAPPHPIGPPPSIPATRPACPTGELCFFFFLSHP